MEKHGIKEKLAAFRQWQHTPHEVAPASDVERECATCHTRYVGNFCPRCGQSARIGRFSFKSALLLYIDVWGLGNRGMFRTIRDLMLRPGYMIRDYLSGMQMAYFPPFKMFFLLATLSFLISSGMNIKLQNTLSRDEASNVQSINTDTSDSTDAVATSDDTAMVTNSDSLAIVTNSDSTAVAVSTEEIIPLQNSDIDAKIQTNKERMAVIAQKIAVFQKKFPNLFALAWLLAFSFYLYLFFRKSPAYPGMRYSELAVAMIYTSNMYSIFSNIVDFLCIDIALLDICLLLLPLVPLHQLSGFRWTKLLGITAISSAMLVATVVGIIMLCVLVLFTI